MAKFQVGHPKYGGRQKGGLNKKTLVLKNKLDELNCHPDEFLARVLVGNEPSLDEHPFYTVLKSWDEALTAMGRKAPDPDEWTLILQQADQQLRESRATLDQRIDIAKNLLPYIAPKLQAIQVELDGEVDVKTSGVLAVPAAAASVAEWIAANTQEAEIVEEAKVANAAD